MRLLTNATLYDPNLSLLNDLKITTTTELLTKTVQNNVQTLSPKSKVRVVQYINIPCVHCHP